MQTYKKISCLSTILLAASLCAAQSTTPRPSSKPDEIPLAVKPGVPIRVALIKSVRIRHVGTQVEGRLVQPLYVFDREVIPANSTLLGSVTGIEPVSRKKRMMALANGNLTPFHEAHVEFTTLVLKNGQQFSIQTDVSAGTTDVISLVAGGGKTDTGRVHGTIGQVPPANRAE